MALAAEKSQIRRGKPPNLGKAVTGASFTGYKGGAVMVNSAGNIVTAADTANARGLGVLRYSTESSPGILGAVPSGTTVEYEWGHEEWFKINSSSSAAFDGACLEKDCVLVDSEEIGAASVTTNDVRFGRVKELQTINGVAGAWVAVGVMSSATF